MSVSVQVGTTLRADAPRRLFSTPLRGSIQSRQYAVSADGQRFLLSVPKETADSALRVVLNWPGLLNGKR
jgi:hypothetical protein